METIRRKFDDLADDRDERGRRRWAAVEARALGRGGITAVAAATGLSDRTIRNGLRELGSPDPLAAHRRRRTGGGRQGYHRTQPGLRAALDRLVEPTTRGSPPARCVGPARARGDSRSSCKPRGSRSARRRSGAC